MRFTQLFTLVILFLLLITSSTFSQDCEPTLYEFQNEQYSGDFHIAARPGGGYFLAGQFDNSAAGSGDDIHLICSDAFGNEVWSSTFVWSGDESATAVRALPDGSAVIVGTIEDPAIVNAAREILLLKVDPDGNMAWYRTYGNGGSLEYYGTDVELLPNGGFVVSGYSIWPGWGQGPGDAIMLLAGPNGEEQLWRTRGFELPHEQTDFPEPAQPEIYNVTVLANGDYLFSGITFAPSDVFPFGGYFTAFRTDADLNVLWEVTDLYGFCLTPAGWDAVESESGDLFFAADMRISICFDVNSYTAMVKVSGDGEDVEFFPIDYTAPNGKSILATNDGNLVIGKGTSIMKVRTDGVVLWESPNVGRFGSNEGNVLAPGPNGGYMLSIHQYDAVRLVEFDSLGNNCRAQLGGQVFYDRDNDCEQDPDEILLSNIVVDLNGEEFTNTSAEGFYNFQTEDAGNFVITANSPSELWQLGCPPSGNHSLEVFGPVSSTESLDFGFQATEQCVLLDVDVRLSWARACTNQFLSIQYCNLGTVDISGVYVVLELDSDLSFIDADVPTTIINDELRLLIGDVAIGECGSIKVEVAVACDAELGTQTCSTVQIFPAATCSTVMVDDTDVDCREIRNSYDPNDKLVVAQDTVDCWNTALDELEYTIRFQNTGNDTAFQVVIIDTLSEDLDLSTFRPGPSTHSYDVRVLHDRQVMFSFPNINLLDSTSNLLESQGSVQFSIHPSIDIPDGTIIQNRAGIYFDYNPPIITPYSELEHCAGVPLTLVAVEVNDISDCETQNGQIRIIGSGGEGTYEYSIDGGESWQLDSLFTNVSAGEYSILLRDEMGTTINYDENPATVVELTPTIVSLNPVRPSSCGGNTGRIVMEIESDVAFQYSIDGGMTWLSGTTIFGLEAGTYEVMVANPCGNGETQMVEVPALLPPTLMEVSSVDPDCNEMNGSITITATGEQSLRFSINGGETWSFNNIFNGLGMGSYQPVVSYGPTNCEVPADETVELMAGELLPMDVEVTTTDLTSCNEVNGQIAFAGGLSSTLYSVDGGTSYQANATFDQLPSGTYSLAISNGCGLADTLMSVELFDATPPMISDVLSGGADCQASTGFLQVLAGTGTGLTYSIDAWMTNQESSMFTDLAPGTYTALVRDSVGCEADPFMVEILGTPQPEILDVITGGAECQEATGFLQVAAGSGTALSYSIDGWLTSQTSPEFTGLPPNVYMVQMRGDGTGCEAETYTVGLLGTPRPEFDDWNATTPACGAADGSITLSAIGGDTLSFSIDGGMTIQNSGEFIGLAAGNYSLVVFNEEGCSSNVLGVQLIEPAPPEIQMIDVIQPSCEDTLGAVTILASSEEELTYSISGPDGPWLSDSIFMDLPAGSYEVVVANEQQLCQVAFPDNPIVLEEVVFPVVDSVQTVDATGGSIADGQVEVFASGSDDLQYSIDGGETWQDASTFENLLPGIYSISVAFGDLSCIVEWGEVEVSFTNSIQDLYSLGISELQLFPNPTMGNSFLQLKLTAKQWVQGQLYSPTGQLLTQYQLLYTDNYGQQLDLSALPAGLYYLKIQVDGQVFYRKLIKQ